ncbi:MAG: rhodanese-like domain-containing protein [Clostridia bacterium]|nr:rhodanese-like domain-containing protein [Clostridia bacterium]
MRLFGKIERGLERFHETPGAILMDVREKEEYAQGHIPGAVNLPLSRLPEIKVDRTASLFLYCLRGMRSFKAKRMLRRMGYTQVWSIGGICDYKGPLEK